MSFNLRYATADDGKNSWPHRKDLVAEVLHHHQPDLLGVQEALFEQIQFLRQALPGYDFVGVGRDDGRQAGEFAAIFYRVETVDCLQSETFWLSETPDEPGSLGWDADCVRICTWGAFVARRTDRRFYLFNTHLDHRGGWAKEEGARLIRQRIDASAGAAPVVLTGDFNCTPGSSPYQILTDGADALQDTRSLSAQPPQGPDWTEHSFSPPGNDIIDFIFVRNVDAVTCFAALTDHDGARYPSDHLPILAEIEL